MSNELKQVRDAFSRIKRGADGMNMDSIAAYREALATLDRLIAEIDKANPDGAGSHPAAANRNQHRGEVRMIEELKEAQEIIERVIAREDVRQTKEFEAKSKQPDAPDLSWLESREAVLAVAEAIRDTYSVYRGSMHLRFAGQIAQSVISIILRLAAERAEGGKV